MQKVEMLPPTQLDELIALGREGEPIEDLCVRFNRSPTWLRALWNRCASYDDKQARFIAVEQRLKRVVEKPTSETVGPLAHTLVGQCFTDDPRAMRPDYGRAPLRPAEHVPGASAISNA